MSNEQLRRMINEISIFLFAEGYSNAFEGDYQLKSPLYSKCNINMTKSGEHQFHRFLPDIDLALIGDDFAYFEGLKPQKGVKQSIKVKLVVKNYIGSGKPRLFTGVVSRKCTEWDFDKKKATLNIEWQDGYTAFLNNLDNEYNVLKLGVKSRNVGMYVPPIVQLYMEGSTAVDNYVGGEHFEGSADSQMSLDELKDDYHFGEIGKITGFGDFYAHTDVTLEVIAKRAGCTVDDSYNPYGKYFTEPILPGFGFDSLSVPNNRYYSLEYKPLIPRGTNVGSVSGLMTMLNNLPDKYYKSFSRLYGTDGSFFSDLTGLISDGKLTHTIGYVALVSQKDNKEAGYNMAQATLSSESRKIEMLVFYGIGTSSRLTITNNNTTSGVYASLAFSEQGAMLGRLVTMEKDNRIPEPYCGYDILKDDPFLDSGHVYKCVIPLDAHDSTHNTGFAYVNFNVSGRYSTDDEGNEYGCYTDTTGTNKYYLPPSGYYDKNKSLAWYPAQRGMWGSNSFWVRFGRVGSTINFWALVGQEWQASKILKDAYGFDDVLRSLFNKAVEVSDTEMTINGTTYHEDKTAIREMGYIRNPDWGVSFFSEFFEYRGNVLRFNQYSTPYLSPASNVIAGDYDKAAQKWNLSMKTVLGWLRDIFNVFPVIRYWYEQDPGIQYKYPYITFEHLTFFEQGHVYGWDAEGKSIDVTDGRLRDKFNKKLVSLGLDKSKDETGNLPMRYEFGNAGDSGSLFNDYNVDMGVVAVENNELVSDPVIKDKCSVKKVNPSGLYTDIDRIYANPQAFDKGQSALIMATRFDDGETVNMPEPSVNYDGRNGKKYLYVGNFNASWMNLSKLHTRYVHTIDDYYDSEEVQGVVPTTAILPYVDCINNGEITTESMSLTPSAEWGANPFADILIGKTSSIDIELPLHLDELVGQVGIEEEAEDWLYAFKVTINGKNVKGITESGEINLLTGKAKFKLKTRPML